MKTSTKSKQVPAKQTKAGQEPRVRRQEPGVQEIDPRLPLKKQRVHAGPCPNSAHHNSTRVYKTNGRIRFCICDDCGCSWKKAGPPAEAAEGDGATE